MFFSRRFLFSFLFLCGAGGAVPTSAQPRVGDPAPDFTLPAATRDTILMSGVRLSDSFGKAAVVLAFYPADWSGGCTREMCTMRDSFEELSTLHALVYGISGDYVYSHREWAKHLGIPFMLLSDHDHTVARAYGSYNPDRGSNRRTVYVINKEGKIGYADLDYRVDTLDSFKKLTEALKGLR
jgi:peroxiredoxin